MQYIYNGAISCNAEDVEKLLPLVQKIFNHPDIEVVGGVTYIVISDEKRGDITEEIDTFCKAMKENGLSATGEISYTGDYDGKYIIFGPEYRELTADECVIKGASDQELIDELEKRGYSIRKADDTKLFGLSAVEAEEVYRKIQLEYACEDAITHANDEDIELDDGDEKYLAKRFLDKHDCDIADNDQWYGILKDYKEEKHNKFYFTFGSDPKYPYPGSYLVAEAFSKSSAIQKFRKKWPDRRKNVYNAAFCYSQEEWDKYGCAAYYPEGPAEVIR